ncbi:hypothetical protein [Streptomyces lancefieldiae]|uniref:Uncharacterized protein n=1 Tax=Streptomyces lancefieldiae TaxID=3075520 RepID=A0ABU3AVB0_9ACTN|nr:hypothetical protein [Streptomyces sp. DSM 40712]MDT0613949.1 hypothetical protein [Streptomyces sp. DSM 40712]
MPRFGLTIDICPRALPFCMIGMSEAGYGFWVDVPAVVSLPLAFLMTFRVTVRRWRHQRS